MSSPYRESAAASIQCPRCGVETPGGDIVTCVDGCGVWVPAEAAADAFEASELRESRITSWFRERCGCPQCGAQMTLRGHDMSLFLGCDAHGFWVDDSTVTQTGLGRLAVEPRVKQARVAAKLLKAERERAAAERERAAAEERARADAAEREARVRGTTRAAEEARAAREAEEARRWAARMARRERLAETVRDAIRGGDPLALVDEIMRLDDAIEVLARRITDGGL